MRDSQRSKHYEADHALHRWAQNNRLLQVFPTIEHVRTFVDTVHTWVKGSEYAKLWRLAGTHSNTPVITKQPRRRGAVNRFAGREIVLGGKEGNPATYNNVLLLHELAHTYAPANVQHGPEFAEIFLRLVQQFMGPGAAAQLVNSYRERGVAYKPKATKPRKELTPEQRAVLLERLKLAREAKASRKEEALDRWLKERTPDHQLNT
jgi:putative metallohydrolase (TIGR04338 family)